MGEEMDQWDFTDALRALERYGFNIVQDREGQAMVVDAVGKYVATFQEQFPPGYMSIAQSVALGG